MRIFITDLQAYNEGYLVGKWVQLPMNEIELLQTIFKILEEGGKETGSQNHEEYFITDYEAEISIDEYDDVYKLNEIAQTVEEYSDDDWLKLKFLSYEGYNERDVIKKGIESYDIDIYDYSTDRSFTDVYELLAQDFVSEGLFGNVPTSFENYIDYSAIGRDLSQDYTEFEHGVLGWIA